MNYYFTTRMRIPLSLLLFFSSTLIYADCLSSLPHPSLCKKNRDVDPCCSKMGGISYCDSSAGRYVCQNGFYSSCYCTRHAIMDMQSIEGCCIWQGGVFKVTPKGLVICNNGGVSELCSLQNPPKSVANF